MNALKVIISILIVLLGCNPPNTKAPENNIPVVGAEKLKELQDTIPKVTGIGGIFFKSQNPAELRKWYGENLGLVVDDFGSPFEFRNAHRPEEINYLNWNPFDQAT